MSFTLTAAALAAALLLGMLGCLELGRRLGRRRLARHPEPEEGVGALDGAVYGLFGLLIAFTFSGAAARFDARRDLVVREANAIGTAYLRVDLLQPEAQATLRPLYRRYVEARLEAHRASQAREGAPDLSRTAGLQAEIWRTSVAAAQAARDPGVVTLVVGALNEMFDVTTTRLAASRMHPPLVVYALLYLFGLASSLVAGWAQARNAERSWLHALVYAGAMAASVYVILDMEFPRLGLVRVDDFDRLLAEVLAGMK